MASRSIRTAYTVPLAGFASPRYISADPVNDAIGLDISGAKAVMLSVVSLGAATIIAEQTLDPAGLVGWFPVMGKQEDDLQAKFTTTINVAAKAFRFSAAGLRMRFRVTALTGADLVAAVLLVSDLVDMSSPGLSGSVAEDGVASGVNPVSIGIEARNTQKAAMSATGDLVRAQATMDGKQVVVPDAIPELTWNYAALTGGIVSSVADVVLKAASGAGIRNYLRSIVIDHDVLGAATEFVIKDGATVIYRGKLQTPVQEGGGDYRFDPPLKSSANAALNFALITSVTGGVFVNASGFTGL